MTDSFMHNHQSALDSFMEDKAIQDLEDAGIYPHQMMMITNQQMKRCYLHLVQNGMTDYE